MNGSSTRDCRHWESLGEGIIQCGVCPHRCRLREGQHGICFVRRNEGGRLRLLSWNRVSSLALDPIEKKPLYHFLPGTETLSLGGLGCNLSCRFCQNHSISKPDDDRRMGDAVTATEIVRLAKAHGCPSVSFTYNEPIVALEFVLECARACRTAGLKTVAVTNGYVAPGAREEFFGAMDAANVDLKSFRDDFYRRLCGARLDPVKETLRYLKRHTAVWLEVTTLLIPGENDSLEELDDMTRWAAAELGPDVPWHFSAFHPTYRLADHAPTPPVTLRSARDIARRNGLRFVFLGNLHDTGEQRTRCAGCGDSLIERTGMGLQSNRLTESGACPRCGERLAGVFGMGTE